MPTCKVENSDVAPTLPMRDTSNIKLVLMPIKAFEKSPKYASLQSFEVPTTKLIGIEAVCSFSKAAHDGNGRNG